MDDKDFRVMKWSKPFYGLQHLIEPAVKAPYQATVRGHHDPSDGKPFYVAVLLDRRTFVAVEERYASDAHEAMRLCEKWITDRDAWA